MIDKDIIESIENELKLLKEIIINPSLLKEESLFTALKDQKSFSNYQNDDLNIKSYSLNSHKTYANKVLTEGYPYLDTLRKKCLTAFQTHIKSVSKPSKVTLSSLTAKIHNLEKENDTLKKHNILLSALTNELTEKLDFYVLNSKDNEIIYEYQDFKKKIECMVRFIKLEV